MDNWIKAIGTVAGVTGLSTAFVLGVLYIPIFRIFVMISVAVILLTFVTYLVKSLYDGRK